VFERCTAAGGTEAECREEAREALARCLETCDGASDRCTDRCEHRSRLLYDRCLEQGVEPETCAARARDFLEGCIADHCL
jgi:hypothetical protein